MGRTRAGGWPALGVHMRWWGTLATCRSSEADGSQPHPGHHFGAMGSCHLCGRPALHQGEAPVPSSPGLVTVPPQAGSALCQPKGLSVGPFLMLW